MMEGTELTLKWEKFGLSQGLQDMLEARSLVDVTIACQGEYMQAHKTILAACSPHFRQIFMANPCQHPVIFMQDVRLSHMKALLNFMYTGEATVLQQELSGFMKTAEAFKVSGLTAPPQAPKTPLKKKGAPEPSPGSSKRKRQWIGIQGMKMDSPGVFVVEQTTTQTQEQAADGTEMSLTEEHQAVESVTLDEDNYADDGADGVQEWSEDDGEAGASTEQQAGPSTSVSSRGVPEFLNELENLLHGMENNEVQVTAKRKPPANTLEFVQLESLDNTTSSSNNNAKKQAKKNTKVPDKGISIDNSGNEDEFEETGLINDSDSKSSQDKQCKKNSKPEEQSNKKPYRKALSQLTGPRNCDICGKVSANLHSLKTHIRKYHSGRIWEYKPCPLCDRSFMHVGHLNRHLRRDHYTPNFDKVK